MSLLNLAAQSPALSMVPPQPAHSTANAGSIQPRPCFSESHTRTSTSSLPQW